MKSADRWSKVGSLKDICISIPCSQDFRRSYKGSPRDDPFLFLASSKSKTPKLRPVCPSRNSSGFSKLFSPTSSVSQTPNPKFKPSICSKPDQLNKFDMKHKRSVTYRGKKDIEQQTEYKSLANKRDVHIRRLSKHAIREIASHRELENSTIEKGTQVIYDYVRASTPSFNNSEIEGVYEKFSTKDMFTSQKKSLDNSVEQTLRMGKTLFGKKMRSSRNKASSCVTKHEKFKHLCELEDISFGN